MKVVLVAVVLMAALTACGEDTVTPTDETLPSIAPTTAAAPHPDPLDECLEVQVESGVDGVEWMAATTDPWGLTALAVAVDGGFLISTDGCATVIDVDGTRRWSRETDHVLNGVQTGDRIVVLTTPTRPEGAIVTAYDATTGETLWDDTTTTGVWQGLIALDDIVVLVGSGEGPLVAVLDSITGEVVGTRTGTAAVSAAVPLVHDDLVIVGFTDGSEGRLLAVDPAGRFVFDRAVRPRYPVPVAIFEDLVVLQASGIDDNTHDVEPATFLAAYDLATGEEAWSHTASGTHAEPAVQVADTIVMSTSAGVSAFDIATGSTRWAHETASVRPALLAPLAGDAVAVASDNGVVEVLAMDDGGVRWTRAITGVTRLRDVPTGHLLVVDGDGRYVLLDGQSGSELWSATGPVPTYRDTPPNHRLMVASDGHLATIGCPVDVARCERTDQRVVVIKPTDFP